MILFLNQRKASEMCASDAYINMIWPVFQATSYRAVDPYSASEIMRMLSDFITSVGRGFIDKYGFIL